MRGLPSEGQDTDLTSVCACALGRLKQHLEESKKVFSFQLDAEDKALIAGVTKRSNDLLRVIGDCGDEYRR